LQLVSIYLTPKEKLQIALGMSDSDLIFS
jgi:hypothetical protein